MPAIRLSRLLSALLIATSTAVFAAEPVKLQMYYPIAVGGAISHTVEALVADFEKFILRSAFSLFIPVTTPQRLRKP
ncbi:hypothetical protein ACFQUX_01835 [Pantoea stewartii]